MLEEDDHIPSVNLGDLEANEDVAIDLVFTYHWTLNGMEADFNALRTAGAAYTLSSVDDFGPSEDDSAAGIAADAPKPARSDPSGLFCRQAGYR